MKMFGLIIMLQLEETYLLQIKQFLVGLLLFFSRLLRERKTRNVKTPQKYWNARLSLARDYDNDKTLKLIDIKKQQVF